MSSLNLKRFCSTKQIGSPGDLPSSAGRKNSYWLMTSLNRWSSRKRSCWFGSMTVLMTGTSSRQGPIEEPDDASLVLLRVQLGRLHVACVRDLPERRGGACRLVVAMVQLLAVAAVGRGDEEQGLLDPGREVLQVRRRQLVGEDRDRRALGGRQHGAEHPVDGADLLGELLAERSGAGAVGDD